MWLGGIMLTNIIFLFLELLPTSGINPEPIEYNP